MSQQRRQRFFGIGQLRQQGIFGIAVVGQLAVDQTQALTHRLLFPQPEPEPVKYPIPERAADIEQRSDIDGHAPNQAEGKDRGNKGAGQQTAMQRADLTGDAKQQRHSEEDQRQWNRMQSEPLNQKAAEGKQAAAHNQTFEEAFMRSIETGDIAAGGH